MQQIIDTIIGKLKEFGISQDIISKLNIGDALSKMPNIEAVKDAIGGQLSNFGISQDTINGAISHIDLSSITKMIDLDGIGKLGDLGKGSLENLGSVVQNQSGIFETIKKFFAGLFGK
jgi:hypothetical protein